MMGYSFGGGWMAFELLLWVGLIALMVWAGAGLFRGRETTQETALAILDRRYARGEISAAEYEQARKTLS